MITEVISTDYSYYVTVPPEAVTEEVYLTALVLGDFTYQSFSAAMLNENTQVAQPEVYTFVYESYETEEPIQTSYVIDYTSYVEVPAELKETVFTYTEYVTDRPSLVQFTEIFTVYVTKAMAVEQAEVTFYVILPGYTKTIELTEKYTIHVTNNIVIDEFTKEYSYSLKQHLGTEDIVVQLTRSRMSRKLPKRIRRLLEKRSQLFLKKLTTGDTEDELAFRKMRNRCKSEIRQWNIRKQATILDLARKNRNVLFKYMRHRRRNKPSAFSLRDRNGEPTSDPIVVSEFYRDHYAGERQLLNDKNKTDPGNLGKSLAPVYRSVNPCIMMRFNNHSENSNQETITSSSSGYLSVSGGQPTLTTEQHRFQHDLVERSNFSTTGELSHPYSLRSNIRSTCSEVPHYDAASVFLLKAAARPRIPITYLPSMFKEAPHSQKTQLATPSTFERAKLLIKYSELAELIRNLEISHYYSSSASSQQTEIPYGHPSNAVKRAPLSRTLLAVTYSAAYSVGAVPQTVTRLLVCVPLTVVFSLILSI
ncbi:hypothetical protein CLF_103749 [Clonorchis sinensis]|uniref:Uncharacterized protein n=1 Tax=Clonorchis sinensis TaxID=79923 RepID=G7YAA8_CLOSI|nr:hypothetical protein CLF_103749 [Clonorchis sinensis]